MACPRSLNPFSCLLIASLLLALSACGDDASADPASNTPSEVSDSSAVSTDVEEPRDEATVGPVTEDVSAEPDTRANAADAGVSDALVEPIDEGGMNEDSVETDDADAEPPPMEDATTVVDAAEVLEETAVADAVAPLEDTTTATEDVEEAVFMLMSPDFNDGDEMPEAFVCCQGNPALTWSGAPEGTLSFVLIYDDPDAGNYDHWAVFNIPASATGIEQGASGKGLSGGLPEGAAELNCGFGFPGYLGPCPPANHTYRWRLWALDTILETPPTDFASLEAAASEASLGMVEMSNTFGPKTAEQQATCN